MSAILYNALLLRDDTRTWNVVQLMAFDKDSAYCNAERKFENADYYVTGVAVYPKVPALPAGCTYTEQQ